MILETEQYNIIPGVVDYLIKNYAKTTAKIYEREITIFLSYHPEAYQYKYKDVLNYLTILRQRYNKPNVIHRIWAAVKVYYKYLAATKQRPDNPAKNINLKDKKTKDIQLQDLLSEQQLEDLLNIKEEIYLGLVERNKVLMSLLIYQALKPNEISTLELSNINLLESSIYVKSTLYGNARTLQLKGNQILLFKNYIEESRIQLLKYNHKNPEIVNTEKALIINQRGKAMTETDITKHISFCYKNIYPNKTVNCQTIRQSVITNLLKKGTDLRIVQAFAGHKHPSTTEKYKQSNVVQLKLALEFYHPIK
jgi:integrase/recombinase XerD